MFKVNKPPPHQKKIINKKKIKNKIKNKKKKLNDVKVVVLFSILLTLNIFHTLF